MKFNDIVEYIFPYSCPFCDDNIVFKEKICKECNDKLNYVPIGYNIKENLLNNQYLDDVFSCFFYSEMVTKAIVKFKEYNNVHEGYYQDAKIFVEYYKKNEKYVEKIKKYDIITSVPSFKEDATHHNQAEMLGKYISAEFSVPYEKLLIKKINNEKQHILNAEQRIKNVSSVYDVNRKIDFENKNILIVDDVITTGSTVNECAKVLKINLAKNVDATSIAVTTNEGDKNGE